MFEQITKKNKLIIKTILAAVSFVFCGAAGFYGTAIFLFYGAGYRTFLFTAPCVLFFILFCLLLFWTKQRKIIGAITGILIASCVLTVVTAVAYMAYDESIPYVNASTFYPELEPVTEEAAPASEEYLSASEKKRLYINGEMLLYPMYAAFAGELRNKDEYKSGGTHVDYNYSVYEKFMLEPVMRNEDILFVINPSEDIKNAQYVKNGEKIRLKFTPVAREAFVFFVNKDNPVNNLGKKELSAIYSEEIANWAQIGGQKRKIKVYADLYPACASGVLQNFVKDGHLRHNDSFFGVNEGHSYKNYKGSIGFGGRYFINLVAKEKGIKMLAIDGVYPGDDAAVESGEYPLTYYIYAVTEEGSRKADAALKFMLSAEGQDIVEKSGYIRLRERHL